MAVRRTLLVTGVTYMGLVRGYDHNLSTEGIHNPIATILAELGGMYILATKWDIHALNFQVQTNDLSASSR